MKRRIAPVMAAVVCAIALIGCGGNTKTAEVSEIESAGEAESAEEIESAEEAGSAKETESAGEAGSAEEIESAEEAGSAKEAESAGEAESAAGAETADAAEETENAGTDGVITVENPGWEYYFAGEPGASGSQIITLQKQSEQKNQITDEEAWFAANVLTKPGFPYEDETYRYDVYGDNGFDVYRLVLSDSASGAQIADLDFSAYRYADDFVPEDIDFIGQRICWAKAEEGVLYVATAHNTYAASSPHTAYLTAVDLSDFHVIWKTAPLMSNASTFEIIGDTVVCGYGFTAEDDFINIIDKKNGTLLEQIPIASKADYLIRKDDVLYVRTYHTDYTFQILMRDEED
ncbi:MAG: hypothetical protein J6C33_10330 [Lachnospiraceae bacterium]|nr:hypothetical protein [Lachnospiraceae bacterium]